ncbi:kinase-like domain-containing protein [Mycena rosella]|uniref:Kinase-like domain-containing protein n=1 Tax=Mycena rosella TaxID=1033263 RepID=A0AAD7BC03_MYCRO|nr:kinase-like domain-containing protein [Mycena rosella]
MTREYSQEEYIFPVFGHGGSRPSTPSYKNFDRSFQQQSGEQLRYQKGHRQGPVSSSSNLDTRGVRAKHPAHSPLESSLTGRRHFESQPSSSARPQAASPHHPYPFAHVPRQLAEIRRMPSHGIPTPASSNSPRRVKGSRLASLQPAKSPQPAKVYTLPCGGQLTVPHVDLLPNIEESSSGEETYFRGPLSPDDSVPVSRITQLDRFPLPAEGNSNIYRGNWVRSNASKVLVLLKTLRTSDDETQLEALERRLRRETYVWSTLRHHNILPFFGLCDIGVVLPALISPFCKFGNIRNYLKKYPGANKDYLVLGVACGLKFLHDNGIVHGDLKVANVLVDKRGVACICDFGISRIAGRPGFTTRSQGTTPYKAPELLADPKSSTTIQSDIYSFALLVLEILTADTLKGRFPDVDSPGPVDVLAALHPQRADYDVAKVPDTMWKVLDKCWNIIPDLRPTMTDILNSPHFAALHSTLC